MKVILAIVLLCSFLSAAHAEEGEKEKKDADCSPLSVFAGEIKEESPSAFIASVVLPCLGKTGKGTVMTITSNGGDVWSAVAIYEAVGIFGSRAKLHTVALGHVASAGVLVFLSGSKRSMSCNGKLFLHPVQSGVRDSRLHDRRAINELMEAERGARESYVAIINRATGLPTERIERMMDGGTTLDAKESKELGFAHDIVGCG